MRAAWVLLVVAVSAAVHAQDSDEAALALADRAKAEPTARRTCVEYAEAAAIETTYSDDAPSSPGGRASFDLRCDGAFARQWRAVFSDRFDYFWGRGASAEAINTLKEAYLSFRDGGTELVDAGVINV